MPRESIMDDCSTAPNDGILARLASRRTGRSIVPGVSGRMQSWLREEAALYSISQGHP
jgi:hypothetical protein